MANLGDTIVNGALRVNGSIYSKDATIAYGTCDTAAATAAKVITINDPSWVLKTGNIIMIKFSATNSASNVTLNVNGTGAKQIAYSNNRPYTGNSNMIAGYVNRSLVYMYDGTYWVWISSGYDANDNAVPAAISWTAAATAAKTASHSNYAAIVGYNLVTFQYANTAASALTLNINGKGAKPIYINGSASSASNYTLPAGCYLTYFNGTNYYIYTDGKIGGLGSAAYKGVDTSMTKTSTSTNVPTTKAVADLISTEIGKVSVDGVITSSNDTVDNIVSLTSAEYNALTTKEKNTLYNITDDISEEEDSIDMTQVIDVIYPVGSIYISANAVNPSTFLGGTWEQIKDRFLLAAGDSYTAGATGGEAQHTLTVNEMPSHTHVQNPHNHSITGSGSWNSGATGRTKYEESNSIKSLATNNATATNQNTGGGAAHNNMPPYLAVYMWKRLS